MYSYKAIILSVTDGDTVRADIDLGMDTWKHNVALRLTGINAPEVKGEEREAGLKAKAFLETLLPFETEVIIYTQKDKSAGWGRYAAGIYLPNYEGMLQSVSALLVKAGHAVWKDYD